MRLFWVSALDLRLLDGWTGLAGRDSVRFMPIVGLGEARVECCVASTPCAVPLLRGLINDPCVRCRLALGVPVDLK